MKNIENYIGYQVDEAGNVWSFWKQEGQRSILTETPHKLVPLKIARYLYVDLAGKGNLHKKHRVHRLIAKAFVPNSENKPRVAHLNGVSTDNRAENLAWVTPKENEAHKDLHGTRPSYVGERNHMAKLTDLQVKEIKRLYRPFQFGAKKLAEIYKVSPSTIYQIVAGVRRVID